MYSLSSTNILTHEHTDFRFAEVAPQWMRGRLGCYVNQNEQLWWRDGGRLQLYDSGKTILLHTRWRSDVLTAVMRPETDITHLLHMWADPSTRTKTHTHVLSLSLPRMFTHTWEGEEEAKYSGICNLRLNGEMVYSVNSQCKGIWWENFKVTQQSNCRIKRQILECFKMFWLCKCHHKWSHKGLYLPHLCLKLHDI